MGVGVEQRGQAEHRPGGQVHGELDVDVEASGVNGGGDVAAGVGDQPVGVGHQLGDAGVDQHLGQSRGRPLQTAGQPQPDAEHLGGVIDLFGQDAHDVAVHAQGRGHGGGPQVRLAAEVVEERAEPDPRGFGDALDARVGPSLSKQPLPGGDQRRAGAGRARIRPVGRDGPGTPAIRGAGVPADRRPAGPCHHGLPCSGAVLVNAPDYLPDDFIRSLLTAGVIVAEGFIRN